MQQIKLELDAKMGRTFAQQGRKHDIEEYIRWKILQHKNEMCNKKSMGGCRKNGLLTIIGVRVYRRRGDTQRNGGEIRGRYDPKGAVKVF